MQTQRIAFYGSAKQVAGKLVQIFYIRKSYFTQVKSRSTNLSEFRQFSRKNCCRVQLFGFVGIRIK
ncbi:hypothetical protein BWD14_02390 [Leptospira santarosai]|uniref:Uncharacterized protein n=1 Tax=Leptospira santarosai TaxID=28183 RepID=A0AB73MFR0_9LEPT|nr:hypothetical protein BWD14_02390 [Leptospira santarosai]